MNYPILNLSRLRTNLAEMINVYSPFGKEQELLDYLVGYFKRVGLDFECQELDRKRYNIIIHSKNRSSASGVIFVGHLDTITAFNLENYHFSQTDSTISGLGAVDMKSGCAAMIEAFLSYLECRPHSLPASLALVVGEEDSGDGIMRLLQDYKYRWAIVAEPSNLKLCLSHYGYLECEISTYGRRRHASYSGEAHNAIYSTLNLLLYFRDYFKDNPKYIYNIRELHSSDAGFSVPDKCICWLDVHTPANINLEGLRRDISDMVREFRKKNNFRTKTRLSFPTMHKGYKISSRESMVKLIREAYNKTGLTWSTDRFRSDSDASILNACGTKTIIVGPGRLAKAHSENETIDFNKIKAASQLYLNMLKELEDYG